MAGLRGKFFYFSDKRLKSIADLVREKSAQQMADFNYFHGLTSWVRYESDKPYFAYSDACFATYVRIYTNQNQFNRKDLDRICQLEMNWLKKARKIFFRSQWALDETRKAYGLAGENFIVAGLGGFIEIPEEDKYLGGKNMLFISREFAPKGGYECFQAFKIIRQKYPDVTLTIIGDPPPKDVVIYPGVYYAGFLRKTNANEFETFKQYLTTAFVLVHPTIKDTNPLVLTEAGYYGCPSISTRSFAIPELIVENLTGFLIDVPVNPSEIAEIVLRMLSDEHEYHAMRKRVRSHTVSRFNWNKVGEIMYANIQ
jgi:glycosyltransferase involved in cell wall biosynthesis